MLAVVGAIAAGCGGGQRTTLPAGEQAIGKIAFVGARSVDVDELEAGLGVVRARDKGQPFARYLVALDRRRIVGFYVRHGFFSAAVETEIVENAGGADVTFKITEGPRATLVGIDIIGLPPEAPVKADALRAEIRLVDGAPFDYAAFDEAKPALTAALTAAGFAHASVEGTVLADKDRNQAVIRLVVDPGPRSRFGEVTVVAEGVDPALLAAARARLAIKRGEPYSPAAITSSRNDLYDLGRFSLVRIEPDLTTRAEIVPVTVKLGEGPRHELRLGGGLGFSSISYEVRGRFVYNVRGWPWSLTNSRFELRPAVVHLRKPDETDPRLDAIVGLERLDLFRPRLNGSLEAAFSYVALEAYTLYGPRVSASLRSPLYHRIVSGSIGWQLSYLRFRDLHPAIDDALADRLGLIGAERVGAFSQSVLADLRNNPLAPTRGAYAELRVEEGSVAAGGELTYLRLVPELRGYLTLSPFTFAARAGGGVILGDVAATQRFFAGGASSQRGFNERRLAPHAQIVGGGGKENSAPYGGAAMFQTGIELRTHIASFGDEAELGAVAFLDGADVTDRAEDLHVLDLHWAAGGGIRFKYVVPFRFDIGYRLNRTGMTEPDPATTTWDRMAFHVSAGEAF